MVRSSSTSKPRLLFCSVSPKWHAHQPWWRFGFLFALNNLLFQFQNHGFLPSGGFGQNGDSPNHGFHKILMIVHHIQPTVLTLAQSSAQSARTGRGEIAMERGRTPMHFSPCAPERVPLSNKSTLTLCIPVLPPVLSSHRVTSLLLEGQETGIPLFCCWCQTHPSPSKASS